MTSVEVTAQSKKTLTQRYIVVREDRQVRVEKMLSDGSDVLIEQILLEAKKLLVNSGETELFIDLVATIYTRPEAIRVGHTE